jgi:hypothetical protein
MKRTIFFVILTINFLLMSVSAQTAGNQVLASGNPDLTQSMIDKSREVFEFVFGGVLTAGEKQTFQEYLIRQWKNNDANTIKATQDLVTFYDQAAGMSKEKLVEVQKQLREPLLKDLRSQADKDPFSKMLVGAYERIQGLNVKQGGTVPVPPEYQRKDYQQTPTVSPAGNGTIPKELLGEWVKSHTSNIVPVNPGGSIGSASGEKMILHFYADGTYEGAYFVQSSMSYACVMTVFMPSTGVYRVQNNTLHLTEKTSRTISKDTCVSRFNYEKNNTPGVYAYPAQLQRDEYGTKLVLTMNDGQHNFYFNTGKSFLGGK